MHSDVCLRHANVYIYIDIIIIISSSSTVAICVAFILFFFASLRPFIYSWLRYTAPSSHYRLLIVQFNGMLRVGLGFIVGRAINVSLRGLRQEQENIQHQPSGSVNFVCFLWLSVFLIEVCLFVLKSSFFFLFFFSF
ncbi:hypothetical protein, unlikely [Trypanosoma congolense IL3000]|uniref:Uncharacterized protein n=1 Tax=Trypanosoma congolense (strain IL3000) TaxID=1068625 RepID=F9W9F4_TRYCI|nr:hypothetical protein, unlikely [Trypanosoma congolense IL3000]